MVTLLSFGLLAGCTRPTLKNALIFSCMMCKGCVVDNMSYIIENKVDLHYTILLDSTCLSFKALELQSLLQKVKFSQISSAQLEEEYGVFGNFILLDSLGKRTDFLTDMHLRDYLEGSL